jgi:hypothetical protein
MRRRIMGFAVAGLLALVPFGGMPAAGAATPQGSCPPTFDGPVAISSLPAELQDFAKFLDTQVGGNNDGLICIAAVATNAHSSNATTLNILDNRVAGF